jgi:hypothetical protein
VSSFRKWADQWQQSIREFEDKQPANRSNFEIVLIGENASDENDRNRLEDSIKICKDANLDSLWIVFLGHGTFDNKTAKFNLRGPDVSAKQIKSWLNPLPCPIVIINCASASGPFINQLAAPNRIVVTATKSGFQYNFARFGQFFCEAIGDPSIDLDKDQQTSLLESFLAASAKTQQYYQQENRLATELALIDDNGDGKGTPADWFQGIRAVEKPKNGEADGLAANQIFLFRRGAELELNSEQSRRRNELERQLEELRQQKKTLGEDVYYVRLEDIMVELAEIYAPPKTEPGNAK